MTQAAPDRPHWIVVVGGAFAVLGLSPATVLTVDLVVGSAPEERAGSAAALSETSGELGVALGIAVMGTILTALYRSTLTDTMPGRLDTAVRDSALDGLPAAQHAAEALPPNLADALLAAARDAFSSSFNTVALVCATLALALALMTTLRLRHPRTGDSNDTVAKQPNQGTQDQPAP